MFADALVGVFDVVAEDIEISVKVNPPKNDPFFKNVFISNVYGDMWKELTSN